MRQNLPTERTRFVGRDVDVAAVRKQLEVGRLVTLTGVGGSGKTRLAIRAASGLLEQFPDGIFFGISHRYPTPRSSPATRRPPSACPHGAGNGSGRPANELIDFLSTREVLLVLDNCEHVIDAVAALVDEILERCRSVTLATSQALGLQGEQVHPVSPLPLPGDDLFEISDAVQLFTERAAAVTDFVLSGTTSPTSPIAGGSTASSPSSCSGAGLGSLLTAPVAPRRPAAPVRGGRRQPDRQRSLQGARLEPRPALRRRTDRLRRLRHSRRFTPHAAVAIVEELAGLEPLLSLLRKSLIVTEDDGTDTRYRMLETVRAYAEARSSPRPERNSASATVTGRPLPRLGGGDTARAHLPRPRRCGPTSSTTCGPPSPGPASRTGGTSSADWPAP